MGHNHRLISELAELRGLRKAMPKPGKPGLGLVIAMTARKRHQAELARLNREFDAAVARRAPASEESLLEARRNRTDRGGA